MKRLPWKFGLFASALYLAMCGGSLSSLLAADEEPGMTGDRLQRLERRLNEVAERQELMLRRFGETQGHQPGMQPPFFARGQEQQGPMPMAGPDNMRRPGPGGPMRPVAAKALHDLSGLMGLLVVVAIICNILLAIWIFTDIRKRGDGSGIFVALALVAGVPAAIIYALARIGDRKV